MEPLSIKEILIATRGKLVFGRDVSFIDSISLDSREVKAGDLFIAIKGNRFDGHNFVKDALSKGASGIIFKKGMLSWITDIDGGHKDRFFIAVDDTINAIGEIAKYYRKRFDIPFIAVTGTCGKTTVKDMIFHLLSTKLKVLRNEGTKNNHIGLPITLFRLDNTFEAGVLELGMNHFGEIDYLTKILSPRIGIITNIGLAHLEFIKNINGVLKAKEELLKNLNEDDIAILNGDDPNLKKIINKYKFKKITFGIKDRCDFYASQINMNKETVSFRLNRKTLFTLKLLGIHNVYNALAAIATAEALGLDVSSLKSSLESFEPLSMRMKTLNFRGMLVIDDTYNANPFSVRNAIDVISSFNGYRKIVVFSDMLELGRHAEQLHREIGNYITFKKVNLLLTIGKFSKYIALGAKEAGMNTENIYNLGSKKEVVEILNTKAKPRDIILFKGSRLTKMEDVINCFTTSYTH
ncbi:MAG: UDP-N-acetylmuramoyl-tripeptide--D-alanyl-D-alanine ligase [Candidatus Omnitrophica bacterium]|nr:UDP-N-acetylmuramoyl-tripeptide--D-alanyl-D-alanine ligase [Candidatus Omnitrophota bacterium]